MPTSQLLMLAETKPLQALHASAGQLRRISDDPNTFLGIYVPSPVSDEYIVVLNPLASSIERSLALVWLVRHHVLAHARTAVYVLTREGATCEQCEGLARQRMTVTPIVRREHALRARYAC